MKVSIDLVPRDACSDNVVYNRPSEKDLANIWKIATLVRGLLRPIDNSQKDCLITLEFEVIRAGFRRVEVNEGDFHFTYHLSAYVEVIVRESWQPRRGGEKIDTRLRASYCNYDLSAEDVAPSDFASKVIEMVAEKIEEHSRDCRSRANFLEKAASAYSRLK